MAQLVVRSLEQSVKVRLQRRAKRHGRSMEERFGISSAKPQVNLKATHRLGEQASLNDEGLRHQL